MSSCSASPGGAAGSRPMRSPTSRCFLKICRDRSLASGRGAPAGRSGTGSPPTLTGGALACRNPVKLNISEDSSVTLANEQQ